jgi:kinesin family protein 3/17
VNRESAAALHATASSHACALTLSFFLDSLEEEIAAKTKRMKKVFAMLHSAKAEIEEVQRERREHHAEMIYHIKEASRELRRNLLVIEEFIPLDYIRKIEQESTWDDATGEWHIPAIASTGNSLRKTEAINFSVTEQVEGGSIASSSRKALELDLEKQYFVYNTMIDESRPPKSARPKTGKPKDRGDDKGKSTAKDDPTLYPKSRPSTAKPRYA